MEKTLLIVGQIAKNQHFLNCYFWVISVLACFAKTSNFLLIIMTVVLVSEAFRVACYCSRISSSLSAYVSTT